MDFFRNVACKRTLASLPCPSCSPHVSYGCGHMSRGTGTRSAVIQTGADEYSRVALRCNELFDFIHTVARQFLRRDS